MLRAINRSAAALMVGALFLLVPLASGAAAPPETSSSGAAAGVVNINTATADQLELLPGIGAVRAQAIIDYRKANGAFEKLDDLLEVKGIGEAALERLRPYVVLRGKTTAVLPD